MRANQEGLELKGVCQLLFYAKEVNSLGENIHTVKKNSYTQSLVSVDLIVAGREEVKVKFSSWLVYAACCKGIWGSGVELLDIRLKEWSASCPFFCTPMQTLFNVRYIAGMVATRGTLDPVEKKTVSGPCYGLNICY